MIPLKKESDDLKTNVKQQEIKEPVAASYNFLKQVLSKPSFQKHNHPLTILDILLFRSTLAQEELAQKFS